MIELARATQADTRPIFEALLDLLIKSPAAQMKLAEPRVANNYLIYAAATGKLWVYGDFALLVDAAAPWYSTASVLIEDIIVRYRREYGNTVDSAIAQLEVLARRLGCVAVAAGDTQIGLMAPRYLAAGFTTLGTQFYKEIPDGVRT